MLVIKSPTMLCLLLVIKSPTMFFLLFLVGDYQQQCSFSPVVVFSPVALTFANVSHLITNNVMPFHVGD
jgi:hypothetical protein